MRTRNITVGFVVAVNLIAQSYLCVEHKQYQPLGVNVHNSRLIYRMLTTSHCQHLGYENTTRLRKLCAYSARVAYVSGITKISSQSSDDLH